MADRSTPTSRQVALGVVGALLLLLVVAGVATNGVSGGCPSSGWPRCSSASPR
ncbi:hypothetical protein [Blastococcus brunescens]|uniref:Uncharacterized protein n=1 Tax=Blastococcus brunescens TaxID=1564165 RepID=A0ABZ1AUA0_9ACTN|nr:hypothetical protein [Blastococcus sp. BMG 8361]WRL62156.1 hypothetical protein U6N30_19140 [Blastococcus sp. BMG 8361]